MLLVHPEGVRARNPVERRHSLGGEVAERGVPPVTLCECADAWGTRCKVCREVDCEVEGARDIEGARGDRRQLPIEDGVDDS